MEELQKEIRQRDVMIQSLVRRVENLERQMGTGSPDATNPPAAASRRAAKSRTVKLSAKNEVAALDPDQSAPAPQTRDKVRLASGVAPTQQAARTSPPAPGQFDVSEDDAERALERTLVATGNLLVPNGFAEVEPLFGYTRRESPNLIISEVNRNEFTWALDLRLGLPWESQFEIGVPYNLVQQQVTDITVAPVQQTSNRWVNSFGDLTVGWPRPLCTRLAGFQMCLAESLTKFRPVLSVAIKSRCSADRAS